MSIVKILVWVTLIGLIGGAVFFQNILTGMSNIVTTINGDFWAYLPPDIRTLFSLIVLGLLFGLVYVFKK